MSVTNVGLSLLIDKDGHDSLQDQIFSQIVLMLAKNECKTWDRLPSIRALARQLHVAKNTIIAVYDRLVDEGYLVSQENRGFFIAPGNNGQHELGSSSFVAPVDPIPTDFSDFLNPSLPQIIPQPGSVPVFCDFKMSGHNPELFPERKWRRYLQQSLAKAARYMSSYPEPAGVWVLREELADYLAARRGIVVEPENITIVNGIQEAINIICALQEHPHPAIVETPCYSGAYNVFQFYKREIHPVGVDDQGMKTDQLPAIKRGLVYTTPSHQYPTGTMMSLERRCELLRWADIYDGLILEDDYDGDLRSSGHLLKSLKSLDYSDRVIYMGSFSKSFAPGLRLGYMVTPTHLSERVERYKGLLNSGCNWLLQTALGGMLSSGFFSTHLREMRRVMTRRREHLHDCLQQQGCRRFKIRGSKSGMHLSVELARGMDASKLRDIMMAKGVRIYPLSELPVATPQQDDLAKRLFLLGFGSLDEACLEKASALLLDTIYNHQATIIT